MPVVRKRALRIFKKINIWKYSKCKTLCLHDSFFSLVFLSFPLISFPFRHVPFIFIAFLKNNLIFPLFPFISVCSFPLIVFPLFPFISVQVVSYPVIFLSINVNQTLHTVSWGIDGDHPIGVGSAALGTETFLSLESHIYSCNVMSWKVKCHVVCVVHWDAK